MSKWTILLPVLTASLLLAAAGVPPKPPTMGDLTGIGAEDGLSKAEENVIRGYIRHWVQQLISADTPDAVLKAREKLQEGYNAQQQSRAYPYEYARIAAEEVLPALSLKAGPLQKAKELSVGVWIAGMRQSTIAPILEKMARHANPAVRYWATKGYRAAGERLGLL